MIHHITRLISEGEHQQLDFKFEIADANKIARTLVAFANTDGGRLLVGVKDNGAISGVRSEEEYYMVEGAARMYCRPEVGFHVKEWEINRKTVLEVVIPRSNLKPHFALEKDGKWIAYHRVHDQNFEVNRILARVWKNEQMASGVHLRITEAEKFLLEYLENHGSISLSAFTRKAGIHRNKAESILVKLILLKIISMKVTENSTSFMLNPDSKSMEKE